MFCIGVKGNCLGWLIDACNVCTKEDLSSGERGRDAVYDDGAQVVA